MSLLVRGHMQGNATAAAGAEQEASQNGEVSLGHGESALQRYHGVLIVYPIPDVGIKLKRYGFAARGSAYAPAEGVAPYVSLCGRIGICQRGNLGVRESASVDARIVYYAIHPLPGLVIIRPSDAQFPCHLFELPRNRTRRE